MTDANADATFLKQAAMGTAAVLAYPTSKVLGANDRVRVGMIGVGDRGNDLLGQIRKVHSAELVAMADVYSRRRDQAKSKVPGIQTFDDHRRLLDMKDIDAVIVASPLHIHSRHFLDTLAAGKDLYSEKTMTWSIPEADKCLAAAKDSKRVIQIGLQHQSSGSLIDAKQMDQRRMGRQSHAGRILDEPQHSTRQGPVGAPGSFGLHCAERELEAFLNGRPDRPFDPYKLINWRLFWEFAGGNCAENMVHQIAWIMGALDLPLPSAAYMSGGVFSEKDGREVPDTIAVTLDFPKDIVVTWQSTFSNKHYELGDRILGSDGTLEHHFDEPLAVLARKDEPPQRRTRRAASQRSKPHGELDRLRPQPRHSERSAGNRLPVGHRGAHGEPVVQEQAAAHAGGSQGDHAGVRMTDLRHDRCGRYWGNKNCGRRGR